MAPKSKQKRKKKNGSRKGTGAPNRHCSNQSKPSSDLKKRDQGKRTHREGKEDNKSDIKRSRSRERRRSGSKDSRKDSTSFSRWNSVQTKSDIKMEHRRSRSRDRSSQSLLHTRRQCMDNSDGLQDKDSKICRDFLHSQCTKGTDCLLYHPPNDDGSQEQRVTWFVICHNHLLGTCDRLDCRLVVMRFMYYNI